MSDPDDPQASLPRPRWRIVVLGVLVALGPLLRLALAVGSLVAIATGGERIQRGAGYLVAGLLVWLELSLAGRRRKTDDES